jgi:hypothetical protein
MTLGESAVLRRPVPPTCRSLLLLGSAVLLLGGCSSAQRADVEQVATTFADPSGDPEARCDLLLQATLESLEKSESAPCTEAIGQLPLDAGEVRSVQVWGRDAQVMLSGDTLFLTETHSGWRVTAAACRPQGDAPYDCEVEP